MVVGRWSFAAIYDRIITTPCEGVAAQQAEDCDCTSAQNAVAIDCFLCVFGATGNVATGRWKQRRDRPLVGSQELQRHEFGDVSHVRNMKPRGESRCVCAVPTGLALWLPSPGLTPWANICRPIRGWSEIATSRLFALSSVLTRSSLLTDVQFFPRNSVLWGLLLARQLLFNDCEGAGYFV